MAADWDTYAAAFLVEAYMQIKKHPAMSSRAIAEDLSSQLRAYAWQKGEQPALGYADVPAIEKTLAAVDWLDSLGLQGEPNRSPVLEDMVGLYKYHYDEFSALLQAARQAIPLPAEAKALLARQAQPKPVATAVPAAQPAPANAPLFTPQERGRAVQLLALCLHWQEDKAIRSTLHDAESILQRLSVLGTVQPQDLNALLEEARQLMGGEQPQRATVKAATPARAVKPPAPMPAMPQPAPPAARKPLTSPKAAAPQAAPPAAKIPGKTALLQMQPGPLPKPTPAAQSEAEAKAQRDYLAEVRECLRRAGRVMTRADIERELGPVPLEKIREAVATTPDLVSGGPGLYLAAAAMPVDLPMLDGMTEVLSRTLAKIPSGKLSDEACRNLLVEHYPELAAGTAGLPLTAFHNVLGYLLGADFKFTVHGLQSLEQGN